MLVRLLFLCIVATLCSCRAKNPAPRIDALTIEMTGEDFRWTSRYPGPDSIPNTADDFAVAQVLTVPVHAQITLQLRSKDYIYSLEIPHKQLSEIAVPDLEFNLNFHAAEVGTFTLPGQQLCGYAHPNLMATLHVVAQTEFAQWQSMQTTSNKN